MSAAYRLLFYSTWAVVADCYAIVTSDDVFDMSSFNREGQVEYMLTDISCYRFSNDFGVVQDILT